MNVLLQIEVSDVNHVLWADKLDIQHSYTDKPSIHKPRKSINLIFYSIKTKILQQQISQLFSKKSLERFCMFTVTASMLS